jgi:hypothetical protein
VGLEQDVGKSLGIRRQDWDVEVRQDAIEVVAESGEKELVFQARGRNPPAKIASERTVAEEDEAEGAIRRGDTPA